MKLSSIFSDGMVLQRGKEIVFWGSAEKESSIKLSFYGKIYETKADGAGKWEVKLPPMEAGGPYELEISDGKSLFIHNILIGDVWLLGGQSNMQLPVARVFEQYEKELTGADEKNIRLFHAPQIYDFHAPRKEYGTGCWESATKENVMNFSAAGYFFARDLYRAYKIPIGLILTAVGGTPVEAWISEPSLKGFDRFTEKLNRNKSDSYVQNTIKEEAQRTQAWYNGLNLGDEGLAGKWYEEETDISDWTQIVVPGYWYNTELADIRGSIWLRKEIELPTCQAYGEARLALGTLVDGDDTYVNGVLIGSTGYQYPPRRYVIPKGVLHEGKNSITVRLISTANIGGFIPDKPYFLKLGGKKIDLKGLWYFRIGAKVRALQPVTFFQYEPSGLYNGMIAPLSRTGMKGIAFYQGESNGDNPYQYYSLFKAMITDWRVLLGQGDLPFLYVQLAGFGFGRKKGGGYLWAKLREEQRKALELPSTAMIVTIDIGEYNDLHPFNKKDLGIRLALAARKLAYGEEVVYSGPFYKKMKKEGNTIRLTFMHTGSGLMVKGRELKQFRICGEDGVFVPGTARIEGNTVVVRCDGIGKPCHVRYAWENYPDGANLYNREGLPAAPFTTE